MTLGTALLLLGIALGVVATIRARPVLTAAMAAAFGASVGVLFWRFATEDWANAYVVSTTRPDLSWPVRMAGLWGGAEGSLLLFTSLVGAVAVLVRRAGGEARPLTALTAAYGVVVLVAADPFVRLDAPAVGGLGLQPVLEHPAMVWHPPILYLGLVGVLAPGLMVLGGASNRAVRRATAVSLALLTAGLATGAAWAHAELGWGGFWAWDPIEAAGLVAWLASATTLHLRPNDGSPLSRAAFLLPGLAAVWATTLTRAGLTGSVHSFADRPGLRAGLLVVAAGWTGVLAWLGLQPTTLSAGSRAQARWTDRRLAASVLLLAVGLVAVGTYEPAIESAFGGETVDIAGVFFTRVLWPLVIAASLIAVRADRRFIAAGVGAGVGIVLTPIGAAPFGLMLAAAGGAVAGSAVDAFRLGRRGWLAHVGVGVALVGIAGTIAATSSQVILFKDSEITVDGVALVHRGIELERGRVTESAVASIEVDGELLHPRLVAHRLRNIPTAEAATSRSLLGETQIILSDGSDGQAEYRINQTPRLNLIWLGAALIALGLILPNPPKNRSATTTSVLPERKISDL